MLKELFGFSSLTWCIFYKTVQKWNKGKREEKREKKDLKLGHAICDFCTPILKPILQAKVDCFHRRGKDSFVPLLMDHLHAIISIISMASLKEKICDHSFVQILAGTNAMFGHLSKMTVF